MLQTIRGKPRTPPPPLSGQCPNLSMFLCVCSLSALRLIYLPTYLLEHKQALCRMMHSIGPQTSSLNILYFTVLYYNALYLPTYLPTVLYCIALYSTALYCTVLCCTALYCTVLYCTVLFWTLHNRVQKLIKTDKEIHIRKNV